MHVLYKEKIFPSEKRRETFILYKLFKEKFPQRQEAL